MVKRVQNFKGFVSILKADKAIVSLINYSLNIAALSSVQIL